MEQLISQLERVQAECQMLRTMNDDILQSNARLSLERDYLKSQLEKLAHVRAVYEVHPPLIVSNHTRQTIIVQLHRNGLTSAELVPPETRVAFTQSERVEIVIDQESEKTE